MRTRIFPLLLTALLIAPAALAANYGSATVERVTSIYDGDTFRANIAGWPAIIGERVPIRVKGVDAPEIRAHCDSEKRLARQAKQFTVAALRAAHHIELQEIERGKYFRIAARVMIDGEDLATGLIGAGLGRRYDGSHREDWCESEETKAHFSTGGGSAKQAKNTKPSMIIAVDTNVSSLQ